MTNQEVSDISSVQPIFESKQKPASPHISEEVISDCNDSSNNSFKSGSYNGGLVSHSGFVASICSTDSNNSFIQENKIKSKQENDIESQLPTVVKIGTSIFSPKLIQQRHNIFKEFIKVNGMFLLFIFTVFVLFWGATYKTESYYHKVNFLAVIQDDILTPDMENISTPMTEIFEELFEQARGTWHVYGQSDFVEKHKLSEDSDSITDKIIDLVYNEEYWVALNVKPNVTANLYNALTNSKFRFFNSTEQFEFVYETGRDPNSFKGSIYPLVENVELKFSDFYSTEYLPSISQNISGSKLNIKNLASSGFRKWSENDYRPFYDRILLTVSQIGCAYLVALTFFQFMNYGPLHAQVTKHLTLKDKITYRILISLCTYFFLSLFICTITAMYQVDFTKAFGRGGFMVYWMSTWLFMWAVGGANENMASLILAVRPAAVGFWILGFMVTNISTGFFPFVLNNNVYRFGYIMPVHNLMDIYRVIFFNTSRWKMGRNYGILIAWIVINITTMPLFMKLSNNLKIRKIKEEVETKDNPSN